MEPHHQYQQQQQPQHIPTATRHHPYQYLPPTSSSPTLCDKRLIRRSTHGTPYPQAIAIPPPPAYLSPGSPSLGLSVSLTARASNGGINSARTPPLVSPFSPLPQIGSGSGSSSPGPAKTTSSLARRRRSTVSSGGNSNSPSPEMNSHSRSQMPPPAVPGSGVSPQQMMQQQQHQQQYQHNPQNHRPSLSTATTPVHSSPPPFWGPGYTSTTPTQGPNLAVTPGGSSLFVADEMGVGGTWRSRPSWNTNSSPNSNISINHNQSSISGPSEPGGGGGGGDVDDDDEETNNLALELESAMDEDTSSDEDAEPQFAPPPPRRHNANGSINSTRRREAEDDLARIAQAMTLLSLKPGAPPADILSLTTGGSGFPFPIPSRNNNNAQDDLWPPHPTPESLLRESLRQSFEAYRTLKLLDKATVPGGAGARQGSVSVSSGGSESRRQSVAMSGTGGGGFGGGMNGGDQDDRVDRGEREMSVVEVLRAYEMAADGVKAASEVMKWAEHWIREERERTRERLLKG